ncbi:unnamed protein product [Linum trigynum]|uniref:Alpha/beta hydrolase fold-3 domain-containing protein n=1 Tax=Linum trigynum TaxID=586398 RepID=A0AAV2EUR6_9ROSI
MANSSSTNLESTQDFPPFLRIYKNGINPVAIAYDALKWVASHSDGGGPEQWLNDHADCSSVFLVGNSAGANIVHRVAIRKRFWKLDCPTSTEGLDDPYLNPAFDPDMARLGCSKVLGMLAGKDLLRERGKYYCELLKASEWEGKICSFINN